MIRARLATGELTTYIGPDPNGGHVIRTTDGQLHTVDDITPELQTIPEHWITSVYQGPTDGICSWPTLQDAQRYQADQLRTYKRLTPLGRIIHHNNLIVIADTTGTPLQAEQP